MSYDSYQIELLTARDGRQTLLDTLLKYSSRSLVMLSTAIPGAEKNPPGNDVLFFWAKEQIGQRLRYSRHLVTRIDQLGWCAIFAVVDEPIVTKYLCMSIEDSHKAARLLDLDVYMTNGIQLGRAQIGAPARSCLLCDQPASTCMRLRRHSLQALQTHVSNLLCHPI